MEKTLNSTPQENEKGYGTLFPLNDLNNEGLLNREECLERAWDGECLTEKRGRASTSMKQALERILTMEVSPETVPKTVLSTPLGENITYLEAIMISQVLKAVNGDHNASVFVRDTSGNKLKEKAEEKQLKLEDLILLEQ